MPGDGTKLPLERFVEALRMRSSHGSPHLAGSWRLPYAGRQGPPSRTGLVRIGYYPTKTAGCHGCGTRYRSEHFRKTADQERFQKQPRSTLSKRTPNVQIEFGRSPGTGQAV
eukprot:scaffold7079_cov154-Pinguiococcus_pyrenoidosus.AAC.6